MKLEDQKLILPKSDLKKLKGLLVISTVFLAGYFYVVFTDDLLWKEIDDTYKANYCIGFFYSFVKLIFIWYNWKKLAIEKKKKRDNTFMMLFLGIIGMWLWVTNKKQFGNKSNL